MRGLPGGDAAAADLDHFSRRAHHGQFHLWYDREVVDVDHAVLLDTRIQWIFTKSRIRRWKVERGTYLELVISASWAELKMSREEILGAALEELAMFLSGGQESYAGEVRGAEGGASDFLGDSGPRSVQAHAEGRSGQDYSSQAIGRRPSGLRPWRGAVRSGRLAAGELAGDRGKYMAEELPASGLMPLFRALAYFASSITPTVTNAAEIHLRRSTFSCRKNFAANALPMYVMAALAGAASEDIHDAQGEEQGKEAHSHRADAEQKTLGFQRPL